MPAWLTDAWNWVVRNTWGEKSERLWREHYVLRDSQYLFRFTLEEGTRKERRNLLGVAAIGIAVVKIPLRPTAISALGINFAMDQQYERLLIAWGLLVAYFLVAFAVYAIRDLISWDITGLQALTEQEVKDRQIETSRQELTDKDRSKARETDSSLVETVTKGIIGEERDQLRSDMIAWYQRPSKIIFVLRILFDLALPVLVGLYAIKLLMVT